MNLDYEAIAAKYNPLEGLSRQQMDWMIVYLAFVREPVMTLDDIEYQWGMQLSADMPFFEAVRTADRIRYEIRCRKERPRRIKNALLVLGCAALLLLGCIEFVRMPRVEQVRRFKKEALNARQEIGEAERKVEECRMNASNRIQTAILDAKKRVQSVEKKAQDRIQSVEKDAQSRIQSAENGARARLNERIAGLVCAAQSGTLDKIDALVKINEQIQWLSKPVAVPVSGELSEIVERANQVLAHSGQSWNVVFDSAEQLKKYLVKNPGIQEAQRLDLSELMVNCYRRALDAGCGKAGFELFLLYDGPKFCKEKGYGYNIEPELGVSAELISAINMDLAKSALIRACEMGDYDALSVALYLSEWRREITFEPDEKWKYLRLLGVHPNVKPEQMDRIARVILGWSQSKNIKVCGCESKNYYNHDKGRHKEMKDNALFYFRQASARGNVDAKRWLIDNGYSFSEAR